MRKGYWIVLVFAIWCVVSALWYMFSVKGLPQNTGLIEPSATTTAIAEIIMMITIAFLLGFGFAWLMRSEPMEVMSKDLRNFQAEIQELKNTIIIYEETISVNEGNTRLVEEKAVNALLANDQLKSRLEELSASEERLREVNRDLETKVQVFEGEIDSGKFRLRILEEEVAEKNKALDELRQELELANNRPAVGQSDESEYPPARPVSDASPGEHDDLTEIKGIGPVFQKKLNLLDIYTFRQISELDGESVERLAELIEVFPARIHRDNWIGQATRLYQRKTDKEA